MYTAPNLVGVHRTAPSFPRPCLERTCEGWDPESAFEFGTRFVTGAAGKTRMSQYASRLELRLAFESAIEARFPHIISRKLVSNGAPIGTSSGAPACPLVKIARSRDARAPHAFNPSFLCCRPLPPEPDRSALWRLPLGECLPATYKKTHAGATVRPRRPPARRQ